uniref:Uncharacterized protein n=1 Tax=Setaria viridis TaxID=4556 RepID=A0A4U6U7I4_SETVI|nr:hypothetical protein SEVIR_6G248601v2 [Setaria viridis]
MPFHFQDAVCCGFRTVLQNCHTIKVFHVIYVTLDHQAAGISKMGVTLYHVPIIGSKNLHSFLVLLWVLNIVQGFRTRGIYELRVFRRETLHWINLLNRRSTPLSRSPILHSNAFNCSSSHTTFLF